MVTKFTWEPSSGGSLLLRITRIYKTSTWTIKKSTKNGELIQILQEMLKELHMVETTEPERLTQRYDYQLYGAVPVENMLYEGDEPEQDQITEEMSRAEQARIVERLSATNFKWYDEDLSGLELRTLGKGDPE